MVSDMLLLLCWVQHPECDWKLIGKVERERHANWTLEELEKNREDQRKRYANMTPEQREKINKTAKEYHKKKRTEQKKKSI